MQQASQALQDAVRSSYVKVDRVKLARDGVVIRELEAHAGSVDADNSAEVMRRFTVEVSDPTGELTPYDLDDDCAPFGTEAIVETGARIPVMTEEVLIVETAAGWDAGTRVDTVVVGDSLVLGYTS